MVFGFVNDMIKSPTKDAGVPTPTEKLLNNDFAEANLVDYPTNWVGKSAGGYGPPPYQATDMSMFTQSEDKYAGTYALEMAATINYPGFGYISNLIGPSDAFFSTAQTVQAKLYAKRNSGNGTVVIAYVYEHSGYEYWYNFTGASAGTWTTPDGGPSGDQLYIITPDGTYTQYTATQATSPAADVDIGYIIMFVNSDTQNDKVLVDNFEALIDGTNESGNGTFENWSPDTDTYNPADNWVFLANREYPEVKCSTGSNSFGVIVDETITGGGDRPVLMQTVEPSGETGDSVDYSVTQSQKDAWLCFLDNDKDNYTQIWNFDTSEWEAYSAPINAAMLESADYVTVLDGGLTPTEFTGTITIPASGYVSMVLISDVSDGMSDACTTYTLPSLEETEYVGRNIITMLGSYSDSDVTDLDADDDILVAHTLGGTPADALRYSGDFKWYNASTSWDFTADNKPMKIANGSVDADAVNLGILKEKAVSLLAVSDVIDMKTPATTSIYTCPAGKRVYISGILVECDAVESFSSPATYNLGINDSDYNNIVNGANDVPAAAGYFLNKSFAGPMPRLSAGEILKIKVTNGATATTQNAKIYILGFLVDV